MESIGTRPISWPGLLVLRRRDVTAAPLDGQLHLELALGVQGGDVQLGVVHLDAGRGRDVRRGHLAGTLLAQVHDHRLVVLGGHDQFLEVQDDVGHVFLDAGHRRELVQDALDPDAGDGRARDGGQQRAPERVADGVAETRLERLDDEPGPEFVDLLLGKRGALSNEHDRSFPRRPLYDGVFWPRGDDPPGSPRSWGEPFPPNPLAGDRPRLGTPRGPSRPAGSSYLL